MTDELPGRGDVDTEARDNSSSDPRPDHRPSPGPTPGAAAASRARRIGGATRRQAPAPRPPAEAEAAGARTALRTAPPAAAAPPANEPAAEAAPARAAAPGWLRWLPALVLSAAALAMAAFFAISSHGVWWGRPSASAVRDEVLAAAKTCVVAANTYSYTNFAAAEQKGAACTTGPQTQRYRNAMATLKPKAAKLKATQVAQVNAAGVSQISQNGEQWTVLVFGQLSIHATQTGPKGRIDPFGAVVRMDHVGGKWLISSIDPISSPTG